MKTNMTMRPTPSNQDLSGATPFFMTHRQAASMVASTIIGVGVLTLPRSTANIAAQNGWLSTLLGAVLSMLVFSLIIILSGRHPGQSIVQYAPALLRIGRRRWIGFVLSIPFFVTLLIYWSGNTALAARIFGEVVVTTVLKRTPIEVIISTMLITACVLVMHDIEVLVRVNEVLIPIVLIPVVIIGLFSLQSAQFENMLPLFQLDWGAFLKGTALSVGSYIGFEVMTMFGAHCEQSGTPIRHQLLGILIPGIVYTMIVFSGIAVFGVDELRLLAWPTLELVKTTAVPGSILERLESAFLGVWVAAVFTTLGNFYYAAAMLVKETLRLKSHRWPALALLPLFYWLSLLAPNMQVLFDFTMSWNVIGFMTSACIPIILLLLSLIRGRTPNGTTAAPESTEQQE